MKPYLIKLSIFRIASNRATFTKQLISRDTGECCCQSGVNCEYSRDPLMKFRMINLRRILHATARCISQVRAMYCAQESSIECSRFEKLYYGTRIKSKTPALHKILIERDCLCFAHLGQGAVCEDRRKKEKERTD